MGFRSTPPPPVEVVERFGSGADGDVTLIVHVTLTRDMHYASLDLASFTLNEAGYQALVNGILRGPGTIRNNASGATGAPSGTLNGGGNGVTATSAPGSPPPAGDIGGGDGGRGVANAGGDAPPWPPLISTEHVGTQIPTGGGGGGGGSGSSTSGGGGGVLLVGARQIIGPITLEANGANAAVETAGGGGGGTVLFFYGSKTGTVTITTTPGAGLGFDGDPGKPGHSVIVKVSE